MALQLAVPLAMWGYRAYRGYRAVQAARRLAQAAEQLAAPAAAGTAVLSANQAIENAQEESEAEEQTTSDWCATCEDPRCRDKGGEIRQRVEELQDRANEMLRDEYNLFQNHYETSNPLILENGARIGSWMGHVIQYGEKQRNLKKLMDAYKKLGCPTMEGDEAQDWSDRRPPDGPATG